MIYDPDLFLRIPSTNVRQALALTRRLTVLVPRRAEARVAVAARRMHERGAELLELWTQQLELSEHADARPYDQALDNAWSSLLGRLASYAGLDATRVPEAVDAAKLNQQLFPQGLSFLTLPYDQEWSESLKRLEKIDADGLAEKIDALCGPAFLASVREAHDAYAQVLGISKERPEAPEPPKLTEPLRALREAIRHYALQLVASVDPENADAIADVEMRLSPIVELRAGQRRNNATEVEPTASETAPEPLPPLALDDTPTGP